MNWTCACARRVAAGLLVGGALSASAGAAEIYSNAIGGGAWSDPATWQGGAVPGPEDDVVLASDDQVVFDRNDVKTDNFKVDQVVPEPPSNPTLIISGAKYYDVNATGLRESGEVGVAGFQIEVKLDLSNGSSIIRSATTAADGSWSITTPDAIELATLGSGITVTGTAAPRSFSNSGAGCCRRNPSVPIDKIRGSVMTLFHPFAAGVSVRAHSHKIVRPFESVEMLLA